MRLGIAVAQLGARMHYAVPNLFSSSGSLSRLFTDICATSGFTRYAAAIPFGKRYAFVKRLLGRRPDVPRERITSFPAFGLEYAWRRNRARDQTELTETHLWAGAEFCRRVLAHGLPPSTRAVYGFNSASLELFDGLSGTGLTKILEQTIAPYQVERQLLAEEASYWGLSASSCEDQRANEFSQRERAEWGRADIIICGSEFVRDAIERSGGPVGRCVVIPYGVAPRQGVLKPKRRGHRLNILTVGAVGLRKGSRYVFEAARQLGDCAEFRMVGAIGMTAEELAAMHGNVQVTGAVPRSEMEREFDWADIFLLPSICEGSATSTYEALAAALPVICTPNTGSVVRDGIDGFIVPVRDVETIVQKVRELAKDRLLLEQMSNNASMRAREFDLASYSARLHACLGAVGANSSPGHA